jgi:hypothetical protein
MALRMAVLCSGTPPFPTTHIARARSFLRGGRGGGLVAGDRSGCQWIEGLIGLKGLSAWGLIFTSA